MITARPSLIRPVPLLTPEENHAMQMSADLWDAFIKLPVLHHSDQPEFLHHFHAIQNMILARAAYRSYMETA